MLQVGRLLPTSSGKKAGMLSSLLSVVRTIETKLIDMCREAIFIKCDVTQWDEQVALFELAVARFNAVDIVVSTAA